MSEGYEPAFPLPAQVRADGTVADGPYYGLTVRDYFAGQALIGLCANAHTNVHKLNRNPEAAAIAAGAAYKLAEAMVAEKSRRDRLP